MVQSGDPWAQWITERRDGGDPNQRQASLGWLVRIRDRVLDQAGPLAGATVLDVGCGDGLIGLAALERVGPAGRVIFFDISAALLERAEEAVRARGLSDRARFVQTGADNLADIADGSVDVVTTRSVLIYVADKAAAFAAMHRVLRPTGRASIFEPVNKLMYPEPEDRLWGYDVTAVLDLADRVKHKYELLEEPATASMTDFDDRDLVRDALGAGFSEVHLALHLDVAPGSDAPATSFDSFLDGAPNPLAPTLRETIAQALDADEQRQLVEHLRQQFQTRQPTQLRAEAFLTAARTA
jgi:ubiquinone/menaquinone biosynthesis C-methylase UbiE